MQISITFSETIPPNARYTPEWPDRDMIGFMPLAGPTPLHAHNPLASQLRKQCPLSCPLSVTGESGGVLESHDFILPPTDATKKAGRRKCMGRTADVIIVGGLHGVSYDQLDFARLDAEVCDSAAIRPELHAVTGFRKEWAILTVKSHLPTVFRPADKKSC